ncbi:erg10, acetyl-CoA C-acetyltransferase [Ceratobasidium sp. 394]|nr:erg10, acetyl-CoA C-acetyltransferase [Ceratobasidium sp. 394]
MPPLATLSRAEFNQACQELAQKYSDITQCDKNNTYLRVYYGWTWVEDTRISGWGQLTRTSVSKVTSQAASDVDAEGFEDEELFEPHDESSTSETIPDASQLYLHECIVWHPTYMVPAYYFQAYDSGGGPANLTRILATDRFQHRAFRNASTGVSGAAIQPRENDNAQFPLLSQGDHPILGTSHWYFHPCETSTAVTEILAHMPDVQSDQSNPNYALGWLETWFTVLGTAIDLS